MRRLAFAALVGGILLATPVPAAAGAPNIYHSITVTSASAYFDLQDGCLLTQTWISSTDGRWASQGGGVTTGGDLAVSVRVTDTCAMAEVGIVPMAGGGGALLYDGFGRIPAALESSPRIASASAEGTVELVDELTGDTAVAWVRVSWSGGPLSHETTPNNHGQCSGGECLPRMEGFDLLVNTHDNNLRRDATATIDITIDGQRIGFGPTAEAAIEQVKSSCMEIPKGQFDGDTDYCF